MKSLDLLDTTTFSGRRFTRKQLALVQVTVQSYPNLSRKELAQTLCEHLNWKTPTGSNKIQSCLALLEKLESGGFIALPAKRKAKPPVRQTPRFKKQPDTEAIEMSLAALGSVTLQRVITKEDREAWKAYIQTYHYLGYKHPVGSHLGYFVVETRSQRKLGCLLFSASAAWALAPRDRWIGWDEKHRRKLLPFILSHDRFLIFPWVKVANLASQVLSLALKQVGEDWLEVHGYRPVLVETFVDPTRFTGACYQASNWIHLGKTQGRGHFDPKHERLKTKKDIYVYPLQKNWQERLTTMPHLHPKKQARRVPSRASTGGTLNELWHKVIEEFQEIALKYDQQWQQRKRVIDSTMLMLLIFRLVSSKNTQSYRTTIDDLWHNCKKLKIPLTQASSIAASSFCNARRKLDETIFKELNQRILDAYAEEEMAYTWQGHRLFAIDGSSVNLPRALLKQGYKPNSKKAHYPLGLLSCLYQVRAQIPVDFDLVAHGDERACAENHLRALKANDVVVYDRGYYSYKLLYQHHQSGIHAIFRFPSSTATEVQKFMDGTDKEAIVPIYPSGKAGRDIHKKQPDMEFQPIQLRLIRYEYGGTTFILGTTLVDTKEQYPIQSFMQAYHSRWGVEELYKVSKQIFDIEDFHSKTERGVKQEIFAHFALITMNRLFANQADQELNEEQNPKLTPSDTEPQRLETKANFKHCIHAFTRELEALLLQKPQMHNAIAQTIESIKSQHQKLRPNRSFPRKSMRPPRKWFPSKKKKKEKERAP